MLGPSVDPPRRAGAGVLVAEPEIAPRDAHPHQRAVDDGARRGRSAISGAAAPPPGSQPASARATSAAFQLSAARSGGPPREEIVILGRITQVGASSQESPPAPRAQPMTPTLRSMTSIARFTRSSLSTSALILRCAFMTVVWSLLPKRAPMLG